VALTPTDHVLTTAIGSEVDTRGPLAWAEMNLDDRSHRYQMLMWFLIFVGCTLRIRVYLFNRSLWLDELALVNNILSRSYSGLLRPLDNYQGAPLGFLFAEKLMTRLFGSSEYALRLLPLLLGIASVFLFAAVAQRFLKWQAALVAVGLFAISDWLVYYASEVKQYSGDVAVAVLLYWVTDRIDDEATNVARLGFVAVIGAVTLWFSHPAFFILAGIGLSNLRLVWKNREWNNLTRLSIPFSAWAISFGILYAISLRDLSHNAGLLDFWSGAFAPFPPRSMHDVRWYLDAFFGALSPTRGRFDLPGPGIAALAYLMGCAVLLVRNRTRFGVLIFPALVALAFSAAHKYPFQGRLLLFLVPSMLLLIGAGTQVLWENTRATVALGMVFLILLFVNPVLVAGFHFVKPEVVEESRPVVQYLRQHFLEGDVLYIDYLAGFAFTYYGPREGLGNVRPIIGKKAIGNLAAQSKNLDQLRGRRRAWVLLSDNNSEEVDFIHYYLDSMGRRLDSFESIKSSVYCYDLSGSGR